MAGDHPAKPWLEPVGRVGIAAKGIVYFMMGVVAIRTAVFHRGRLADQSEVLVDIAQGPAGKWVLLGVALGLCGFVIWRLADAVLDPWRQDRSFMGAVRRGVSFASGLGYAGFAVSALRLALAGQRPARELTEHRALTSEVLAFPGGQWVIGLAGIGVAVFGLVEVIRGLSGSFLKLLRHKSAWASRIGRVGLPARGLCFMIVGYFFFEAGYFGDAHQVRGLDGAMRALARSGGGWVLGLVGAGLCAYGLYQFFDARDRDFAAPKKS